MNTYDLMTELSNLALDRSKIYNEGSANYAFAFGWFVSDMGITLNDMGLTKKQLKVIQERVEKLQNLTFAASQV